MLSGKLFLYQPKYEDELEYNNSISAYYVNDLTSGYECCKQILINNKLSIPLLKLTMRNMMFYKHLLDKEPPARCCELFYAVDKFLSIACQHNENYEPSLFDLWNILFVKTRQMD